MAESCINLYLRLGPRKKLIAQNNRQYAAVQHYFLSETAKGVGSEICENEVHPKVNWQLRFWPQRQLNARHNHYRIAEVTQTTFSKERHMQINTNEMGFFPTAFCRLNKVLCVRRDTKSIQF